MKHKASKILLNNVLNTVLRWESERTQFICLVRLECFIFNILFYCAYLRHIEFMFLPSNYRKNAKLNLVSNAVHVFSPASTKSIHDSSKLCIHFN